MPAKHICLIHIKGTHLAHIITLDDYLYYIILFLEYSAFYVGKRISKLFPNNEQNINDS